MKKFLLILTGLFAISTLVFVSCSKSDNNDPNNGGSGNNGNSTTCPAGYYPIDSNCIAWNVAVSGQWKYANTIITIVPSTVNPYDFTMNGFFSGLDSNGNATSIMGKMKDSSSFDILPLSMPSNQTSHIITKGDGQLNSNGLQINGMYTDGIIIPYTSWDQNGQPYTAYDTTYHDYNYTFTKD